MKKKISIIFLAIAMCLSAVLFAACNEEKTGEKTEYEWTYVKEFVDEHDADMSIDGVLNEGRWQDCRWLTHTEYGVTMYCTTLFTEKGLYIGAMADDPDMKWSARFNFSNNSNAANSAFWFNIEGPDVQDRHAMRAFNFFVDAFDSASRNQTRFEAKAKVNGDIMKFEATEMTVEFFASWKALNIDVSEGLPEFVRIIPSYRHVKDIEDPNTCQWIKPIYTLPGGSYWDLSLTYAENLQQLTHLRPWSGMKFDSTGYINADKEDAVVGDAANGYSKSSGWDLTDIDNGVVKAYGPDEQAIFFKDIDSSKYIVSAKMKLIGGATHAGGWVNKSPSGGLINMCDETESIAFYVSGNDILNGSNLGYHTLNKYTGWTDVYEGYCNKPEGFNAATDTIDLKCIKYDENLFYFINDRLVLIKRVNWLQGNACPGLYGLSAEVEFSDFSATDYENDADALKAIISEYAYEIKVTSGEGGFVTVDTTMLRKGDDLTVTVTPSAGYVLSSFTINGVDRYDYVVNNISGGKVLFDDITEDSDIEAEFTKLVDNGVRVLGKITYGGKAVTTSEITVKAPADQRVSYTVSATANGSFSFMLSPAGTYVVGENTITLDGKYVIYINTVGYRDKTIDITVNADEKTLRIPDIELEKYVVGGSVTISGKTYNSGKTNWDMTNEADSVIRALKGSNCSLVYFTDKTGADAAIDFTITNKTVITDSAYETQPCMGVSIGNGNSRFDIFVLNEGLRISPRGGWNNDEKAYNVSVPVSYSLRTKESPETLTFRLVRSGSYVALLYKNGDNYVEIWRTNDSSLEKMSAYAFTVCQSNTCDLEFSNYSIKLGDEAKDYIEKAFYETVTLSDYDTTKGTVTIEGANANGKVKHGDSFSVVVDSRKIAVVSYNGETKVFTNGGIAKFIAVKGVDKVIVELLDNLVTVTGTVSLDSAFGSVTVDYSGTELTFVSNEYTFTFTDIVNADGTFTVELPVGEYRVSAKHPSYYAKATTVTISEDDSEVAVKFDLSAVTSGNTSYKIAEDGTLIGEAGGQGVVKNFYFGEAEAFTLETHIAPLDLTKDKYARAGLVVVTPGETYRWMLRHAQGSTPEWQAMLRYGDTAISKNITDLGDGLTLKLDYNGSMLKAYVNGELFGTFTNGYTNGNFVIADNAFGGAIKAGLTSVGTSGVFTDYKFIPREVTDIVSLADYDTTQGTVTITKTTDTIKYGDKFTVSVSVVGDRKVAMVTYGGKTEKITGNGSVEFTADTEGKVSVEFETMVTGTGTVSLDSAFGSATVDYSGTKLTFASNKYTFTFDDVVNADGTFEVELPAGEYSVSATHPSYYAKTTTVTVSEESETVVVKLNLSAVTSGDTTYEVAADGTLTGHAGGGGVTKNFYFGEAEAFTLETHIAPLDLTKDNYARAGLVVVTPVQTYRWMLRHAQGSTPEWWAMFRYEETNGGNKIIYKEITDLGDGLTLKLDYNGSMLKVYVNGELFETLMNGYTNGNFVIADGSFGGAIKAGLTSVGTSGVFTDYKFIPREVTDIVSLADYDTDQGTVTITKTTDTIKYGDKFTVEVETDNDRRVTMITYGGKTEKITGNGSVEFTATTEGKVTVEFETMVTASGTVSLDSAFGTPTVDYSGTKLTFVSSKYSFTFDDVVNSDGTFEVELPVGEYSVSATHPSYYAKATTVTISEDDSEVAIKFDLSAVTSGDTTYEVAADGTLTGHAGWGATKNFYFGEAEAFTLETHIAPLDLTKDNYARAGLIVVTPAKSYGWTLKHAPGLTPEWQALFRYEETNGNKSICKNITDLGDGITLKLDYNGSMLKAYVNGELFATLTNGYTNGNFVIADDAFGGAIEAGLTSVGTSGVFTDYKFIPREVTDIVSLEDYDTTQGTVTITKTAEKIKYGDKFTVTVGDLDDQKRAKVTYGNKTVSLKNGETAEFTADTEGEVSVEFVSLGTLYVSTVDFYEYETNGGETVTKTVKVSADVDGTVGIAGATFNNLPDGVTVEAGSTAGEYVLTVPVTKIDELVKYSDVTVAFDGATDAKVTFNYNAAILKDTVIYSNIDTVSKKSTNKQGGQVFTGIDLGTDSFTVAFMAHNLNRIGTGGGYILFSTGNTDVSKGINVYANADKFRFRCAGVSGNFPIMHNVSQYTDWTHLAFTFDRSVAGELTITVYVNYNKIGSTTKSLTTDETFTYGDSKNFVVGSINGEMWKENGAMAETNQYNLSAAGVTIYRGVAPIGNVQTYFENYLGGMTLPATDAVKAKFTFADGTTANSVSGSSVTMAKKTGTTEPVEGKDGGDDKAVQINSKSDYYDVNGFDVSTGSFAVSMDLKMDFTTELTYGGSGIVLFATTDPDATSGLAVSIRKNTIRVRINGSTVFFEYLNLDVCTGKWTNIAVAFVRENGKCSITVYVNNAPEETKTIELDDSVSLSGTDNAGYLGIGNGSPAYQSSQDNTHTIDNVTLISGAITAENMFALMNN